ncbi:hypothetical protein [Chengkuizengella axinellae]|uniref:Uncharacterized protein n=1 Tax=Chengkuizengella axinellae TaxID=3064388 RepID=A0ABT9J6R0_9BACL|nr:hypothetical protein [Chengkuizengella sp. 2205SS18-9]MDP5277248.1 hypothetical protein [Chengkuizengella sp. 2205SS18-9]
MNKKQIKVDCKNKKPHSIWLYSIDEYYSIPTETRCDKCGSFFDWKNAKGCMSFK